VVEFVSTHCISLVEQHAVRGSGCDSVAQRQSSRHGRIAGDDTSHWHAIEMLAEHEKPRALGVDGHTVCGCLVDSLQKLLVFRQWLQVFLGETTGDDEPIAGR